MKLVLTALALAGLCACRTEHRSEAADSSRVATEHTQPERAWSVLDAGVVAGYVVLFSDPAAPANPNRQFFSVRNPFQQELGMVDGLGRIWRYQPHQREAQLLGSGTLIDGVRRILDAGAQAELSEVPLASLADGASARPR